MELEIVMAKKKTARAKRATSTAAEPKLYTLEVYLISGSTITEAFVKKNPVVLRVIQIRGDQTLRDLHDAIFDAFNRFDEHAFEFQFGKKPMDPKGPRYSVFEEPGVGSVDTRIDELGLKIDRCFGYWFDFGDDWWHQIDVAAIDDVVPQGKFPKLVRSEGESPPQYPEEDEV